jgi:hypothetical protein
MSPREDVRDHGCGGDDGGEGEGHGRVVPELVTDPAEEGHEKRAYEGENPA